MGHIPTASAKHHRANARQWLMIGIAVLVWVLSRNERALADEPTGLNTARRSTYAGHLISPRLTASDDGPFFSLADLDAYVPVPNKRAKKWEIKPPIWTAYPPEIKDIPFVPRAYAPETITYLAQHEVEHGDRQKPHMALTFDCETGSGCTAKILDTLEEQGVQATFFVLGKYAYLYPELIHRIVADGHEVGNHSFFHPLYTAIPPISATQETIYTEAVIDWAAGRHVPMRYIRFPYGGRNDALRQEAAALGYQSAFWDIDPRGWDPETTVEDVVEHVRHTAHNGGIVIMHCGSWDDANALADVIRTLRELGFLPGSLTEVLTEQDKNVPNYPKTW